MTRPESLGNERFRGMRAVIRNRVSSVEQAEHGWGLPMMEEQCRDFCAKYGIEVVGVYVGEGEKSNDFEAASLQDMLAAKGSYGLIVGWKRDRIARERDMRAVIEHETKATIVSVTEPNEPTPEGEFTNQILDAAAELMRAQTAARVKNNLAFRASQGLRHGCRRTFGFKNLTEHDPLEQPAAERMCREFDAGRTLREIADDLDRDGYRGTRGGRLTHASVAQIIASPATGGFVVSDGTLIPGTNFKPLVDPDLWVRCNARLTGRRRTASRGRGRVAERHLCSGDGPRLYHEHDGELFRLHASTERDRYRCAMKDLKGGKACSLTDPMRAIVDRAIRDLAMREILDIDATIDGFVEQADRTLADLRVEVAHADRVLMRTEVRLKTIQRLVQDEKLEPDDYAEQRHGLLAERREAETQIEMLRERERLVEASRVSTDAAAEAAEWLRSFQDEVIAADDVQKLRRVASHVIDRIIVHEGPVYVEIGVADGETVLVEDGAMVVGPDCSLEIVWKSDAVLAEASPMLLDTGEVAGSIYPEVERTPFRNASTRRR